MKPAMCSHALHLHACEHYIDEGITCIKVTALIAYCLHFWFQTGCKLAVCKSINGHQAWHQQTIGMDFTPTGGSDDPDPCTGLREWIAWNA